MAVVSPKEGDGLPLLPSLHARKNDTPEIAATLQVPIVMVTVIAFAYPSSRDEVLFHFIPLRAALSAFARVIGNISSKGRRHFAPPAPSSLSCSLAPFSFRITDNATRSSTRRIINYRTTESQDTQASNRFARRSERFVRQGLLFNCRTQLSMTKHALASVRVSFELVRIKISTDEH